MSPWLGGLKKEPTELILGGAQPGYSRRHLAADVSQNVYEIVGRGHSWGEGPRTAGSTKWRRDNRLEKPCSVFEADANPGTPFRRMSPC